MKIALADLIGANVRVRVGCTEADAREYPARRIEQALLAVGARMVRIEYDIARASRTRDDAMTADLGPAGALERYLASREDLHDEQRERMRGHATVVAGQHDQAERAHAGGSDLRLVGIECADFLGIGSAELNLDGAGVLALTGAVGAGKSSIACDAVTHALFGVTRYGAKTTDRVVRQGGELAETAVTLRDALGHSWRIVRKVKAGARGAAATLDVLERNGTATWRPVVTSAKIAAGQDAVDRILGGLTYPTLTSSSIVVQRDAGRFCDARPEERKALLASAAGLSVYDDLAERTREILRSVERDADVLNAKAAALRERVGGIPALEAEHTLALAALAAAEGERAALRTRAGELAAALERERGRAAEYERALGDATRAKDEQIALEAELATWDQRRDAATRILVERARLQAARGELDAVRTRITALEAEQARQLEQLRAVRTAEQEMTRLEVSLRDLRIAREHVAAGLRREIEQGEAAQRRLDDASCCAGEPSCVFIDDARKTVARLRDLDRELAAAAFPTADETALQERVDRFEIPDEPDTQVTAAAIAAERAKVPDLERRTAVAEKIAKAEQILEEHASATTKLREQIAAKRARVGNLNQLLLGFDGSPVAAAARLEREQADAERQLESAREAQQRAAERAAGVVGRLEELRGAVVELEALETEVAARAVDAAALSELAAAWKACRVMVLETSVIPSVEATANEVLRKFPYGLQLAFSTQRETRAREQSETLEIEILGDRAAVYEGLSGGQRTAVDVALHIAIAVVVSRRASSRISYLFLDEPEGLDEPGRAAIAGIAQWLHQELGLTVVLASHSADLIEALGGRRIDVVAGAGGSTVVAAA